MSLTAIWAYARLVFGQRSPNRPGSSPVALLMVTAALLLVTATACASPGEPTGAQSVNPAQAAGGVNAAEFADFEILPYQGEDVLGAAPAHFSDVFEHGRPVVLNFWAGRCPPCRAEMPAFQEVADAYGDEVIFLGVDVGLFTGLGTPEDAQDLLKLLNIRYPAGGAAAAKPLQEYEVRNMPTTIFLSADGRVVDRHSGMLLKPQLEEAVDRLVAESS